MTMQAEMTYDQSLAAADKLTRECEAEIARLRVSQAGQMVESLVSAGVDSGSVSHLADVDDAIRRQITAAEQQLDHAQAFKASLIRTHGAGAEYHQSAPNGGAEKSFLQE